MRGERASIVALALMLAACSGTGDTTTTEGDTRPSGSLLVSAAASLTHAFADLGQAFSELHPDVEIVFNFGPSSGLREQILAGAPADIYASANTSNMKQVEQAGEVSGSAQVFALNLLQIAVPAGNPGGVTSLSDFARSELLIGLCAEDVPCGDFARQALAKAGVIPSIDTNETDVSALLTKIEADELDAGITYVTDVKSNRGAVDGVDIPDEHNVTASYPIALLANAPNPEAAAAFVAFVLSSEGQRILGEYGFASP